MEPQVETKPRVLIIEDDPGHSRLLELYVLRSGCNCDCAFDGKTGLNQASKSHYDLVFTDINIPEIDGFMVATQLRDRGIKIPLVAITALKLEGIRRKALNVGYSDFLEKPLEQEEISRILHSYLFQNDTK